MTFGKFGAFFHSKITKARKAQRKLDESPHLEAPISRSFTSKQSSCQALQPVAQPDTTIPRKGRNINEETTYADNQGEDISTFHPKTRSETFFVHASINEDDPKFSQARISLFLEKQQDHFLSILGGGLEDSGKAISNIAETSDTQPTESTTGISNSFSGTITSPSSLSNLSGTSEDTEIRIQSISELASPLPLETKLDDVISSTPEMDISVESEESIRDNTSAALPDCEDQIHTKTPAVPISRPSANNVVERPLTVSLRDFKATECLGQGAFGEVYLAKLRSNKDRVYAVKALRKKRYEDQSLLGLLMSERKILHTLAEAPEEYRRFFLTLEATFQDKEHFYIATPFIQGGDLSEKWYDAGCIFPEALVKFYMAELVLALEYLRECRIVHRDLKLENVLIDGEGHLVIADFGLSKMFPEPEEEFQYYIDYYTQILSDNGNLERDELIRCDPIARQIDAFGKFAFDMSWNGYGTHGRIAPEILLRQPYSYPVDIWALGVMLFMMLYGDLPFEGTTDAQYNDNVKRADVRFPCEPDVEESARELIDDLLEKDPLRRPSASEVRTHKYFENIEWKNIFKRSYNFAESVETLQEDGFEPPKLDETRVANRVTELSLPLQSENKTNDIFPLYLEDFEYASPSLLTPLNELPDVQHTLPSPVEIKAPVTSRSSENDVMTAPSFGGTRDGVEIPIEIRPNVIRKGFVDHPGQLDEPDRPLAMHERSSMDENSDDKINDKDIEGLPLTSDRDLADGARDIDPEFCNNMSTDSRRDINDEKTSSESSMTSPESSEDCDTGIIDQSRPSIDDKLASEKADRKCEDEDEFRELECISHEDDWEDLAKYCLETNADANPKPSFVTKLKLKVRAKAGISMNGKWRMKDNDTGPRIAAAVAGTEKTKLWGNFRIWLRRVKESEPEVAGVHQDQDRFRDDRVSPSTQAYSSTMVDSGSSREFISSYGE